MIQTAIGAKDKAISSAVTLAMLLKKDNITPGQAEMINLLEHRVYRDAITLKEYSVIDYI